MQFTTAIALLLSAATGAIAAPGGSWGHPAPPPPPPPPPLPLLLLSPRTWAPTPTPSPTIVAMVPRPTAATL
ncbi:uncharacterized protein TrAFT101_008196 [Trichoderma asperellum]|uniref:uncharacterized protein n=1 Tax=Trichoderma asperellum TaxID=101201 RepID=UPI00332F5CB5|nr:hypothetical protein TrAFT101_008196 [Trichoderma asperellum]